MTCDREEELLLLVDGELRESSAKELRKHVEQCGACRERVTEWEKIIHGIAVPVPPTAGSLDRLVTRLALAPAIPPRTRRPFPRVAWSFVGAVAAAAAFLLVPHINKRTSQPGEVTARGVDVERSLHRDVGVSLFRSGPIGEGDSLAPTDPIGVQYNNLGNGAFLLVFARDAQGEIHWIAPAYLDPDADPLSITLSHSDDHLPLPGAMILERPAPGPMQVYFVISREPHHVSEVERLGAEVDFTSLKKKWPDDDIRQMRVSMNGREE